MKAYEAHAAKGHHYGKLDVSLSGMRSNDAGNVFGFKLQSREATFGDFGFSEFDSTNPNNPYLLQPTRLKLSRCKKPLSDKDFLYASSLYRW